MRLALPGWLALAAALLPPPGGTGPTVPTELAAELAKEPVQAAIPEGSVLVELFLRKERYLAAVEERSGDVAWVDLGYANAIDRAVDRLRLALSDPNRDPIPPSRALDAMVMQPLRPFLGASTSVFLRPAGALER